MPYLMVQLPQWRLILRFPIRKYHSGRTYPPYTVANFKIFTKGNIQTNRTALVENYRADGFW